MDDPDELVRLSHEMGEPREFYLKWRAVNERYEMGRHSKLSECFVKAQAETVKERESIALASDEYKEYLEKWDDARKEMVKAQVQFENLKCRFEAIQSKYAFLRESMKHLG